ncbi:MAG TPA: PEMT/PEM2 methyltransferase family protein [Gemmatimonadales bacterium]|nr:PEMT/PEM2 methyltransferase family protein [Gemmatimonadales bacterium]
MIALAYQLASRLAYVLYIGIALARHEREAAASGRYGGEDAFRRFRRAAAFFMYNDALSLVLLCVVTWGSLPLDVPRALLITIGALLVLVGLGTKLWARATVGAGAYYWRDFFFPVNGPPVTSGPYAFLKNPMYTVGYLQTYGVALVAASLPGLVAALIDHAGILIFYRLVERPHVERMHRPDGSIPVA